jgi:hypothetical protein
MVTHTLGLSRDAAFVGYSERYLGRQSSSLENHGLPLQQKEHLVFETKYGEIMVELQKDYAPQTVRYVKVNLLGLLVHIPSLCLVSFLGSGCAFF